VSPRGKRGDTKASFPGAIDPVVASSFITRADSIVAMGRTSAFGIPAAA
jgi:hypothetical protein